MQVRRMAESTKGTLQPEKADARLIGGEVQVVRLPLTPLELPGRS